MSASRRPRARPPGDSTILRIKSGSCAFVGWNLSRRPVQVRRQEKNRVSPYCPTPGRRRGRLLRHAVRGVGLLRSPTSPLSEQHRRAGYAHTVPTIWFRRRGCDSARARERPSSGSRTSSVGVREVRADSADPGREVEHAPGLDSPNMRSVSSARVVVARLAWQRRRRDPGFESIDEMRAEEPAAAGDENPHRSCAATVGLPVLSQSTRPIQRSRFSAYQAIVWAIPSSHDMSGSQPVSSFSFS